MIISATKNDLSNAIAPAAGFASNKSTIASTEGILLRTIDDNSCEICAYDLEKGMRTLLSCQVDEPGCYIINANRLTQIIRTMPEGTIKIKVDNKSSKTVISCGRSRFELQALNGIDFPDLPELKGENGFTIKSCDLKRIFLKTQFAIAVNSPRPEMNGLNLSYQGCQLTAVSCDGSRLAVFSEKCDINSMGANDIRFNIIIPGKSITELMRFLDDSKKEVTVLVARKHIIMEIDQYTVFTRLIDAQYMDYDRFLPKNSKIFADVSSNELIASLERALLVTEEKQQGQIKSPVVFSFHDDVLEISSSSISGNVCDEVSVQLEGEAIEIGFNCRFLCDALKVCDCENVHLSMNSPLMGMTIEPLEKEENRHFLLLVLPVRLNK